MFVERFPAVAEAGYGADPAYTAWYEHAFELTKPGGLLVMYGEFHNLKRGGNDCRAARRAEGEVELTVPGDDGRQDARVLQSAAFG